MLARDISAAHWGTDLVRVRSKGWSAVRGVVSPGGCSSLGSASALCSCPPSHLALSTSSSGQWLMVGGARLCRSASRMERASP